MIKICLSFLYAALVLDAASAFATLGGGADVVVAKAPPCRRIVGIDIDRTTTTMAMTSVNAVTAAAAESPAITATASSLLLAAGRGLRGGGRAVAGRIPWSKLRITKAQALKVVTIMKSETHALDLWVVGFCSVFSCSVGKILFEKVFRPLRGKIDNIDYEYKDSKTYKVARTLTEAARIAIACYFIDTFEVYLEVTGIKSLKRDVSTLIANLMYATWACFKVRSYKKDFVMSLMEYTQPKGVGSIGAVEIVDKIADCILFLVLSLIWIDILGIKRGNGLSSIFALGGAGTFALTLACKDVVKKALNGLTVSASDAFHVGDSILLGDKTAGTVTSMGWLTTEIRGSDELVTLIPNTELSNVRISNRSRMKFSQVKQELHFFYEDIDKIPSLVEEIRNEIAASCPKVVTDGSRVFRVAWTDIGPIHLKVDVDCRLRNPPIGNQYFEARQGIMEAIARAARRKEVEFAVPTERIRRDDSKIFDCPFD